MLYPLASLWRHQARVSFYTSGSLDRHIPSVGDAFAQSHATPSRRRFSSANDAFNYLRQWQGEPAARAELKRILQRCGPSLVSSHAGIDGWLHALAARLAAGAIEVLEEHGRCTMPGRLVAAASAGAPAVDIAALPSLSALVVENPVVPDVAPDVASDLAPEQPAPLPDTPAKSVESAESAESSTSQATPEAPAEPPTAPAVEAPQASTQPAPADALEPAPVPVSAPMLLSDAPAESGSSEVAPETPTQTPDTPVPEWTEAVDQQAQAQALEQAADSGAPFCEICARQQQGQGQGQEQEQAPGPAPLADAPAKPDAPQETPDAPAPEWPQAADQVAQAQALEQAAESGVPFCEICAKQQLTRQETNDG